MRVAGTSRKVKKTEMVVVREGGVLVVQGSTNVCAFSLIYSEAVAYLRG